MTFSKIYKICEKVRLVILLGAIAIPILSWSRAQSNVSESPGVRRKERIALSVPNSGAFFNPVIGGAKDAEKSQNFELLIMDSKDRAENQASQLLEALKQGIDGIAIFPTVPETIQPAIEKVIDSKTPIVSIYVPTRSNQREIPNIGVDDLAGGGEIANYLIEKFPEHPRIVLITGPPRAWASDDRSRGFKDTLRSKEFKHTILAEQPADWDREKARAVTLEVLSSHPGLIDVIVAFVPDQGHFAVWNSLLFQGHHRA